MDSFFAIFSSISTLIQDENPIECIPVEEETGSGDSGGGVYCVIA
ncbi:pheromone-related peptide [Agaricus bisporus var. burnettii JB137-S8]|uniref:Pheromone-related peptide n=1 Tax=Agaricus bisporus var. burnettii (strain JB137-S8 / ATCC MYA-4627 / FGSC 10392) TaxID=597362 RepID=K5X2J8_AGABU|nr:pheromone-related peptide [Agaricus bisporus var. burnettii JB137-S8]EKM77112.1 pheromone-related peptide [Agaricus bisporus var. burnettii JB137-S8]